MLSNNSPLNFLKCISLYLKMSKTMSSFSKFGLIRSSSFQQPFQVLGKLRKFQKLNYSQFRLKSYFNYDYKSNRLKSGLLLSTGFFMGICYNQSDILKSYLPFNVDAKALVKEVKLPKNDSKKSLSSQRFNFIAETVEKVAPSLVFIEIREANAFFRGAISVSNGSGFIIDSDGLIMTNAHVVANKKSVTVKLSDGRIFNGTVQFSDDNQDLALISINCRNLPSLELGKSNTIRPGEWVVALGSPFCLTNSVTAGVVSSSQRFSQELGLHQEMEYIQTDASINIGNSGGPLVNLDGEVIGINTMQIAPGVTFAIPSDYIPDFLKRARKAIAERKKFPEIKRRYLGITMLSLTPKLIDQFKVYNSGFPEVKNGVLIIQLALDSPSYRSGLLPGDVIVNANDKKIYSVNDIYKLSESGKPIEFTVHRGNSIIKIKINFD